MKIKYLPFQPHCFSFGGFELQMLNAFNAVKSLGVNISKMDIWSKDDDFEILHCWGLELPNVDPIMFAKRSNKKVVLTALLLYLETFESKIKFHISSIIRKAQYLKQIINNIDALVVVNNIQADVAIKYFGMSSKKIYIIPNIIEDKFIENSNNYYDSNNKNDYVLTVGNISKRKNQLTLAHACLEMNQKMVIVGKIIDGEYNYGNELLKIIKNNSNIKYLGNLPNNSNELISIYKNCLLFALPSFSETQPISVLEAISMGKPILLANRKYAKQEYFQKSLLVNPKSIKDIKIGIEKIKSNPNKYVNSTSLIKECNMQNVGNRYYDVYKEVLK